MPVIKSAAKKQRQDKKRQKANQQQKELLKTLIKKAHKNPTEGNVQKAISLTDKSAKKNIIHKNKAARIKSALSKITKKPPVAKKPDVKPKQKKTKAKTS